MNYGKEHPIENNRFFQLFIDFRNENRTVHVAVVRDFIIDLLLLWIKKDAIQRFFLYFCVFYLYELVICQKHLIVCKILVSENTYHACLQNIFRFLKNIFIKKLFTKINGQVSYIHGHIYFYNKYLKVKAIDV